MDSDNLIPFHNSVQAGEAFLSLVYEAWKNSPERDEILLCITFDEAGGLYDHVSPPPLTGLRVPTLFVSSHLSEKTLSTHTCSEKLHHTSILKSIQSWLNLPSLNDHDEKTNLIPISLFSSSITMTKEQMPTVKPLYFENVEKKLKEYPIRNPLGRTIVEHFFCLCEQKNLNWPSFPTKNILSMLHSLRKKNKWFEHLEYKLEVLELQEDDFNTQEMEFKGKEQEEKKSTKSQE